MVVSEEATALTQGAGARRLGRRLLLAAGRGDNSWARQHLRTRLYDTDAGAAHRLTAANFAAVAYASTRMLHAWEEPGWVDGQAAVDASYTCVCPARELAELGYAEVLAIACAPGPLYANFFGTTEMPARWYAARIHILSAGGRPVGMGGGFQRSERSGAGAPVCRREGARAGVGKGLAGRRVAATIQRMNARPVIFIASYIAPALVERIRAAAPGLRNDLPARSAGDAALLGRPQPARHTLARTGGGMAAAAGAGGDPLRFRFPQRG